MKIFGLCSALAFCILSSGCSITYSAKLEVDSAELANEIRAIRQEFKVYGNAVKESDGSEEDKKILNDLERVLDKDIERAHKRSLELHENIKKARDK